MSNYVEVDNVNFTCEAAEMTGLRLGCEWRNQARDIIVYSHSRLVSCILFIILCVSTPYTAAAEDANAAMMREVIDGVSKLCSLPSQKGEVLEYSGSGEAGVTIRFVGVKGGRPYNTEGMGRFTRRIGK